MMTIEVHQLRKKLNDFIGQSKSPIVNEPAIGPVVNETSYSRSLSTFLLLELE